MSRKSDPPPGKPTVDLLQTEDLESATMRKVAWRLVPFLCLIYVVAFIDRINIGFAALTMSKDLGLTPAMFGLGAGIFFIGYFLFEVPSNLILQRVGARRWIARVMITWGIYLHLFYADPRRRSVLHPAIPAGRGRGRLLPGHYSLSELLVSETVAWPGYGRLHVGHPGRQFHRWTRFREFCCR